MPITGTDKALAEKMKADINSKLQAKIGSPIVKDEFLQALCEAISETVIQHIVQNATVLPGIPVQLVPPQTAGPGKIS